MIDPHLSSVAKTLRKKGASFNDALQIEISRARRHERPLALAGVRILLSGSDALLEPNRTKAFQAIETSALDTLRSSDFFARHRESVLTIALPETGVAAAERVVSKLLQDGAVRMALWRSSKAIAAVDVAAAPLSEDTPTAERLIAALEARFDADA